LSSESKKLVEENQGASLLKTPATMAELENQLLQSIERLDRGEGADGEEVFRRLRKKIEQSRNHVSIGPRTSSSSSST
jgi:hypothetical protein